MSIKKKVQLTILSVISIAMVANLIVHNLFYNPHHPHSNLEKTERIFTSLNLMFSPSVTESAIKPYGQWIPPAWPTFSIHRPLEFRFLRDSAVRNRYAGPFTVGIFDVRFGRATLRYYDDGLGFGDLTVTQSTFLPPFSNSQNYFATVSDETYYIVWIGFDEPMDGCTFIEQFGVFYTLDFSSWRGGISWIAVKTADNPEDICLGVGGTINIQLVRLNNLFGQQLGKYHLGESTNLFITYLRFLIDNRSVADMFINTGLWESAETADFGERLAFVEENGIKYLGFVAHLRGSDLREFEREGVNIIRLIEDK